MFVFLGFYFLMFIDFIISKPIFYKFSIFRLLKKYFFSLKKLYLARKKYENI